MSKPLRLFTHKNKLWQSFRRPSFDSKLISFSNFRISLPKFYFFVKLKDIFTKFKKENFTNLWGKVSQNSHRSLYLWFWTFLERLIHFVPPKHRHQLRFSKNSVRTLLSFDLFGRVSSNTLVNLFSKDIVFLFSSPFYILYTLVVFSPQSLDEKSFNKTKWHDKENTRTEFVSKMIHCGAPRYLVQTSRLLYILMKLSFRPK